MSEVFLGYVGELCNLRELNLSNNRFSGINLGALEKLDNLRVLDLSNNNISMIFVKPLSKLSNLEELYLAGNSGISCNDFPLEMRSRSKLKIYLTTSRRPSC